MDRYKEGYNDCDMEWRRKIEEKLLKPIHKEANEINKIFFEKEKGFEVEGAVLQELGAIEGMILDLLKKG